MSTVRPPLSIEHGVCLAAFNPIVPARRGGHFGNAPDCRGAGRQISRSRRACAAAALSRKSRASTASPSTASARASTGFAAATAVAAAFAFASSPRVAARYPVRARTRTPGRFTRTVRRWNFPSRSLRGVVAEQIVRAEILDDALHAGGEIAGLHDGEAIGRVRHRAQRVVARV